MHAKNRIHTYVWSTDSIRRHQHLAPLERFVLNQVPRVSHEVLAVKNQKRALIRTFVFAKSLI